MAGERRRGTVFLDFLTCLSQVILRLLLFHPVLLFQFLRSHDNKVCVLFAQILTGDFTETFPKSTYTILTKFPTKEGFRVFSDGNRDLCRSFPAQVLSHELVRLLQGARMCNLS